MLLPARLEATPFAFVTLVRKEEQSTPAPPFYYSGERRFDHLSPSNYLAGGEYEERSLLAV
jgi:hypothetical protein